jgi:hypothetical protein
MAAVKMFESEPFKPVAMPSGFDDAPLPVGFLVHEIGDAVDALPGEASRSKLLTLRQRAMDSRSIWLPISDEIREQRNEKQRAYVRLRQLQLRKGEGGPELSDDDWQVIDIKKKITRLDAEIKRLTSLEEHRGATMHNSGMLVRACEDYLRRGRPGGTALVEAAVIESSEILKKGERLVDGLERMRMRGRELDADAHRIRSSAFPSDDCKRKAREQIEAIAASGAPSVDGLVEHFGDIGWPQATMTLPLVAMIEGGKPIVGNAQGQATAALAFMVWLHKAALLKAIDSLIGAESDDAHALSQSDREMRLAEIENDKLHAERQECALVWHGQARGEAIEHRADASPQAVLGVELLTATA